MPAYQYHVTQETHPTYTSYGLACASAQVQDICCDRRFAEQLAEQFNRFSLSPLHLAEAVQDALM